MHGMNIELVDVDKHKCVAQVLVVAVNLTVKGSNVGHINILPLACTGSQRSIWPPTG
jgi:hypothetical protein